MASSLDWPALGDVLGLYQSTLFDIRSFSLLANGRRDLVRSKSILGTVLLLAVREDSFCALDRARNHLCLILACDFVSAAR